MAAPPDPQELLARYGDPDLARTLVTAPEAAAIPRAPEARIGRPAWRESLPALSSTSLVLRELDRTEHVRRLVDEVARKLHAGRHLG